MCFCVGLEERMQAKLDRINITKNGRKNTHNPKMMQSLTHRQKVKNLLCFCICLASFNVASHFCVYPNEERLVECYKPLDLALLRSLSQETSANTQKRHENKF